MRNRYSPQAFYYYKAFGGFAEYIHTETPIRKGAVRDEIDHDAWQIAASYVLTGEEATDERVGVRPARSFDYGGGHLGAVQIAARYHTLSVDEEAFTLGFASPGSSRKADAWTIGLNWYLTQNFRYTVNVERTVFDDDPSGPRRAEHAMMFRHRSTSELDAAAEPNMKSFIAGILGAAFFMGACGSPLRAAPASSCSTCRRPNAELYQELDAAFMEHWRATTGRNVTVKQSHGGAGCPGARR